MEAGKELGLPSPSCLNNLYRNPDYKPTPIADFLGSGWGQRYGGESGGEDSKRESWSRRLLTLAGTL